MGIRNGVTREPRVSVEVAPNRWVDSDRWPVSTRETELRPRVDGSLVVGAPRSGESGFTNNPQQSESAAVGAGDNPNRLRFTTRPLAEATRIGGTVRVRLDIEHTAPTGQVAVALVDYGDAARVLTTGDGARTLDTESCWGEATAADDACYFDVTRRIGQTPLQVLARGWARLDGPGRHHVSVDLTANDVTVEAGHQLGLIVYGASPSWLETVDAAATPYTVDLRGTSMRLPTQSPLEFADAAATRSLGLPADLPTGTVPKVPARQIPW